MTTRLITHLGLGRKDRPASEAYDEVAYRLDGRTSKPTRLVQQAILELSEPAVDEVSVFVTPEAADRWGSAESVGERLQRPVRLFRVGAQASFAVMQQLAAEVRRDRPDQVILDVTHGFRVQPLVAVAALQFALADLDRRGDPRPQVRIVYGRDDGRIEDLTPILTAAQWSNALDGLLRFGRADALAGLVGSVGAAVFQEQGRNPLHALSKDARDLADGLALAKARSVVKPGGLAEQLSRQLAAAAPLMDRVPVLELALADLQGRLKRVQAVGAQPEHVIDALIELADWYLKLERFSEFFAVLRETAISGLAYSRCLSAQVDPASPHYDKDVREGLANSLRGPQNDTAWSRYLNVRNEVQHAEFQKAPMPVQTLRKQCAEALEHLRREWSAWRASPEPSAAVGFVNCTNHPSAHWSQAQRAAAVGLGGGPVIDVPFPNVPPEASLEDLRRLAKATVQRVLQHSPRVVAVQGEFVMAFMLVRELGKAGVTCVAAASDRQVSEQVLPDGAVSRNSVFRFRAWRPY